jgi:hypothetical protein
MMYRKTWSHEVWFEADSNEEAIEKWESVDIGSLDKEVKKGNIGGHDFIEDRSFEDENYTDVED